MMEVMWQLQNDIPSLLQLICVGILICFCFIVDNKPDYYYNGNLEEICTPMKWQVLQQLLIESDYDVDLTDQIVSGFHYGFDLGYEGLVNRTCSSNNLPFHVDDGVILWNKLIKEVRLGCVVGPFAQIPFRHYVQSPIGLVPKDNGRQTRLIFHLSYDFKSGKSVNHFIPKEKCSVHYYDLDHAVKCCLMFMKKYGVNTTLWFSKSDGRSTFRVLPRLRSCWFLLTMKARDPRTGEWKFFIDKCLPFGARISCALFQMVSDALRHLLEFKVSPCLPDARHSINNYLDDFLFIALTLLVCNWLIQQFLDLCSEVGMPIAMEKTEWGLN